jgi:hypothetical protein
LKLALQNLDSDHFLKVKSWREEDRCNSLIKSYGLM